MTQLTEKDVGEGVMTLVKEATQQTYLCWLPHFCLAAEEVEVHIDTG